MWPCLRIGMLGDWQLRKILISNGKAASLGKCVPSLCIDGFCCASRCQKMLQLSRFDLEASAVCSVVL